MPGICLAYACLLPQILTLRFAEAPRSDVYDKLKAGIFNLHRKTGEQLLSMFRQLIVVGAGLIPTKDLEAMIAYVRWADMMWRDRYTGEWPRVGLGVVVACAPCIWIPCIFTCIPCM